MPHSRPEGKPWMIEQAKRLAPKTILDVGVGSGTYWALLHKTIRARWTGVEIFAPYVGKYRLDRKYDRLIIDDFLTAELEPHDLVILGDVLEHCERPEEMWDKARALGNVLCMVPLDHFEQGTVYGNAHEAHVWHPTHDAMLALGGVQDFWLGPRKGAYLA